MGFTVTQALVKTRQSGPDFQFSSSDSPSVGKGQSFPRDSESLTPRLNTHHPEQSSCTWAQHTWPDAAQAQGPPVETLQWPDEGGGPGLPVGKENAKAFLLQAESRGWAKAQPGSGTARCGHQPCSEPGQALPEAPKEAVDCASTEGSRRHRDLQAGEASARTHRHAGG